MVLLVLLTLLEMFKKHHSAEHYQIQFVSCSTKSVDKNKRKGIMKNERQIQILNNIHIVKHIPYLKTALYRV